MAVIQSIHRPRSRAAPRAVAPIAADTTDAARQVLLLVPIIDVAVRAIVGTEVLPKLRWLRELLALLLTKCQRDVRNRESGNVQKSADVSPKSQQERISLKNQQDMKRNQLPLILPILLTLPRFTQQQIILLLHQSLRINL